jgi:hypothetical protein
MKAKALKLFGVAAIFAVALVVNASVSTEKSSQDVNLADLANVTEANGECYDKPSTNNGRCGMTGNCYALSSPVNCDSTANW